MRSSQPETPWLYLKPGELYVLKKPALVSTVLGSCVSVTFFTPRLQASAICHAMLPSGEKGFRYLDRSMEHMLARFDRMGIRRREIEVKLFGGADMFTFEGCNSRSVGRQNIELALKIIDAEGLRLKASDIGGGAGRKLLFRSHTGEVFLKRLNRQAAGKITKEGKLPENEGRKESIKHVIEPLRIPPG